MRSKGKYLISIITLVQFSYSQEVIGAGLFGDELFDLLNDSYQASGTLGYNNARDIMYSEIDIKD